MSGVSMVYTKRLFGEYFSKMFWLKDVVGRDVFELVLCKLFKKLIDREYRLFILSSMYMGVPMFDNMVYNNDKFV